MSSFENGNDTQLRQEARQHVRALRGFYIHAVIYASVMVFLLLINMLSGSFWRGDYWVQWPATGWGIALVIHGVLATRGNELFGRDWEERKVDEYVRRKGGAGR